MTPVGVHPQLAVHLHNVVVGLAAAIEILGNGCTAAAGVNHKAGVGFQRTEHGTALLVGDGDGGNLLLEHPGVGVIAHFNGGTGLVINQ